MGFIIILVLTTLAIAGCAAFFSVVGLASVFSGAYWSTILMGGSLEAGKLVAASLLYRYWSKLSVLMRTYLFAAIVALMGLTSMGIFGYLSDAFQDNMLPYQQNQQQIALLQDEVVQLENLKAERLARSTQINDQIANLPNDFVSGRQRLIAANKDELDQIKKDVAEYTEQIRTNTSRIAELKSEVLQQTSHVGPIIFIAEAFGQDVTQATKWLILLIIFVFDPLAVVLTIGTNIVLEDRRKQKGLTRDTPSVFIPLENPDPVDEIIEEVPSSPPLVIDHEEPESEPVAEPVREDTQPEIRQESVFYPQSVFTNDDTNRVPSSLLPQGRREK